MRPIFLIGYMAAGKTTLGRVLAQHLGVQFIDLDFYITQRFRLSIPEIFEQYGEDHFRELESRMLREVGQFEDVVIACGGGTPCSDSNIEFILNAGTAVFLDASVDCIVRRLKVAKTQRPIAQRMDDGALHSHIREHLAERLPYYARAQIRISSNSLESRTQIDTTLQSLLSLLQALKGA